MPGSNSSSARRGSSVRPSALASIFFRGLRSPPSMRKSSSAIPAAGRPRAVSRTWVVRKPPTRSGPPLYPGFDLPVRIVGRVEDLVVVRDPEPLQIIGDVVHVRERVPDLVDLGDIFKHRLAQRG